MQAGAHLDYICDPIVQGVGKPHEQHAPKTAVNLWPQFWHCAQQVEHAIDDCLKLATKAATLIFVPLKRSHDILGCKRRELDFSAHPAACRSRERTSAHPIVACSA